MTLQTMHGIELSIFSGLLTLAVVIIWIRFLKDAPTLSRTSIHPELDSDWKSQLKFSILESICCLLVAIGCLAVSISDLA